MTRKIVEIVLMWLIALAVMSCAAVPTVPQVAPLDGDVLHLFSGTVRWVATNGGPLVQTFYNPTNGWIVHARPLADGWAVTCGSVVCPEYIVGYLMNCKTYSGFARWLVEKAGYSQVARALPSIPVPTLVVLPVVLPAGYKPGDTLHAWELFPGLLHFSGAGDVVCGQSDSGIFKCTEVR